MNKGEQAAKAVMDIFIGAVFVGAAISITGIALRILAWGIKAFF